ncbi:MAG: NAD-dependent epimerase/dehydratase family protein [Ferruginibacter sp.]
MTDNILISGINGFVGTNLSKYLLNKKYNLYGLGRNSTQTNGIVDFIWENLERIKESQIEVIIHLAGKAHDLKNTSKETDYFAVNTELTRRLFDVFLNSAVKDFIYFSSVKAVADTVDEILSEIIIANPQTPYGRSKQQAEEYLLSKQLAVGKRLFIIRPCIIHGPGNKGNLNLLYKLVVKGIPYPLAAFDNRRSLLSVSNLCYSIERLILNKNIPGGIYNLADDEPLSTNMIIEIISETIGTKPKFWRISPKLISAMARWGDNLNLPLNSERLKKLTENYIVSNKKIKMALDINSLPISSKDGLITTIKSFGSKV